MFLQDRTHVDFHIAFATLAVAILIYVKFRKRSPFPLPPGPRGLPLLGNLLQFPTKNEWLEFDRISKEIESDIVFMRAMGMNFLVLNSWEAINDLFEKKSSIYSSRPHFPMVNDLIGWNWMLVVMKYGNAWRAKRRTFTSYFQSGKSAVYPSTHIKFVRNMLPALLDRPDEFFEIFRHAVGGSALELAYGLPIKSQNDPYIEIAERALRTLNIAAPPGKFLVNIIPILKYIPEFFPGAGFKRKAREWRKFQEDFINIPFRDAEQRMANGTGRAAYTTISLQGLDGLQDTEQLVQRKIIKETAGMIFVASTDTTFAVVLFFLVAMMYYPEAQKKAQEEIDRVLGGRLPEFSDEADLPYLTALVKEVFRWNPIVPLGVPHCTSEDDVYRGYFVPKGTFVIGNIWSLQQDEKEYPEPSIFRPERFLHNGKLNINVKNPLQAAFGFGRRICPGSHVGWSYVWLTAATFLSTFSISQPLDENGIPFDPQVKYHSSATYEPLPFNCTIKPRSEHVEGLIRGVRVDE